ncbi:acylphosphatase [Salinicoccus sp. ID82-1]|uniref:acylphosphatase n=1 Tax=Salinicoccus cyprini TaxID=2493691 RepID=A0A558AZA9_9STAP|nr:MULTISPECIES: acylphosphatase [Salinicoccus]MCG1009149.1 acylphosphatase [Salinicoccus sp. ID82-1]TVT29593.1 acylphosphatase [Salinicoccus cyprini]
MESRMISVSGHVQGVGFRYSTKALADRLNITGYAANVKDHVEILATGETSDLDQFVQEIIQGVSPASRVDDYTVENIPLEDGNGRFVTK